MRPSDETRPISAVRLTERGAGGSSMSWEQILAVVGLTAFIVFLTRRGLG